MKTATLDSSFHPDWLGSTDLPRHVLASAAGASSGRSGPEPEPVGWRSEAFAEDLSDLFPSEPAASPRRPLLRRALAAVLRR
jgi:hypothetical protein